MPTIFKNGIIKNADGSNAGQWVSDEEYAAMTAPKVNQGPPPNMDQIANIMQPFAPGLAKLMKAQSGVATASGGANAEPPATQTLGFNAGSDPAANDWRVRISLSPQATYLYNDPANAGIMAPLFNNPEGHRGVIFPNNPSISLTHTARYNNTKLTHSNYDAVFYEGSEVSSISIDGEFTVQTQNEAKYLLAAVYFFRSATKMWFGKSARAGMPPPIVFLDGYGDHYFPHVPCVITSFQHAMPNDVDYIATTADSVSTRIPTLSTIQLSLQPIYSRRKIYNDFNLDDFAAGRLITKGFI